MKHVNTESVCLPDLPEAAANNTEGCPALRNMFSHLKKEYKTK